MLIIFLLQVNEFILFEKNLLALNMLADDFPQDACHHDDETTTASMTTGYSTTFSPANVTADENFTLLMKRDVDKVT